MIDRTRLFALVSAEMIAADEIFGTYQQMEEDRWLRVLVEEVGAVPEGLNTISLLPSSRRGWCESPPSPCADWRRAHERTQPAPMRFRRASSVARRRAPSRSTSTALTRIPRPRP